MIFVMLSSSVIVSIEKCSLAFSRNYYFTTAFVILLC